MVIGMRTRFAMLRFYAGAGMTHSLLDEAPTAG